MDLEDFVEAELAGEHPEIPDDLREPFERAMAAHEALRAALGDVEGRGESGPPLLSDDFEVVRELGRGGMGVVYLAQQKSLMRPVAVKLLRSGDAAFHIALRRFLDEARHLARLRHPHIVAVHEVGRDGRGEPYFVMDYVEGETLTSVLARRRITPTRALAVLKQVGDAVQHAHERGIVHRDLKPGNILLAEDGTAFVTDFGLARDVTRPADPTGPVGIMGTPAYMAPEQARGQADLVGEATDVHALGAILYELLVGRPPYGNDRAADVLARLLREEPPPPRAVDRRIPRDLETICLKALAKEPSRRYATVAALLEDLRRFEAGIPPRARRLWTSQRVLRLMRRRWKPLAALAAVAAAACMAWSLVVPRLVGDEASRQMLEAAEWQHHEGRHEAAVGLYAAALEQIDRRDGRTIAAVRPEDEPARRLEILRRIQRCVGEIDDPVVAAEVALPVINRNPWIPFPHRDLAIARLAFRRAAALGPRPWENEAARRSDRRREEAWFLLGLARGRLERVIQDPAGAPAEARAAARLRDRIAQAFATGELPTAAEADRDADESDRS
jgi:tRNA A-37 threonylcarbamoyl transferase component Bud32